jgi:hypothetical protein
VRASAPKPPRKGKRASGRGDGHRSLVQREGQKYLEGECSQRTRVQAWRRSVVPSPRAARAGARGCTGIAGLATEEAGAV